MQKISTKNLVLGPFLILVNNTKQPLHAGNSIKNKIFCEKDYQKALKKLTLLLFLDPVPLIYFIYLRLELHTAYSKNFIS